jgi:hypothetical protein
MVIFAKSRVTLKKKSNRQMTSNGDRIADQPLLRGAGVGLLFSALPEGGN